jgi:hypothetical protein
MTRNVRRIIQGSAACILSFAPFYFRGLMSPSDFVIALATATLYALGSRSEDEQPIDSLMTVTSWASRSGAFLTCFSFQP